MTSCAMLLLCALTITLQVHDVTSWSFSPVSVPLLMTWDQGINYVTILCQADTPLHRCQVNVYDPDQSYDFVDLSRGSNSGVNTRYRRMLLGNIPFNVSYAGTGLENGQCGAVFSGKNYMMEHFGCRGANVAGEWQDQNVMRATNKRLGYLIPATMTPVQAIAKPGSVISVLLHTKPMVECVLTPPANPVHDIYFYDDDDKDSATESYRYFGAGLLKGDCGATFLNVTEEINGPLEIEGTTSDKKEAKLISIVVIATPPAKVFFIVNKMSYSVGDTLKATCSSLLSRPVANLTWTLDDRIIRQDATKDLEGDMWTWSWEKQNITQILSLKLETGHFGKKLECQVQHLDSVATHFDYVIKQV